MCNLGKAHLEHEIAYTAVEDGVGVVVGLDQDEEILAGAGHNVTVQLQVQIPKAGVQAQVPLLLWLPLHPHSGASILSHHIHCSRGEGPCSSTCRPAERYLRNQRCRSEASALLGPFTAWSMGARQ